MTKKEFTAERPKQYNNLSDVELIELLDTGALTQGKRDVIKALLDKRSKIAIQDLGQKIEKFDASTTKLNKGLLLLTFILLFLGLTQLLFQIILGFKEWWTAILYVVLVMVLLIIVWLKAEKALYPTDKSK